MQNLKHLRVLLLLILACSLMAPVHAEEEEVVDNTKYYEISPPFVVNLISAERRMRFLQVRIQILGSPEAVDAAIKHNAPLRDIIITTLSAQTREDINTPKKKKALQEKIRTDVEKLLTELTGTKQIEGLYFTSFVIQ